MKVIVILLSLCWSGFIYSQTTCTTVISPADGELNVALDTALEWTPVEGINAYLVTIGTTPGGGEILFQQNVGLTTTYRPTIPFPANTQIYVQISLFFINSPRIDCTETIFVTERFERPPNCTSVTFPISGSINAAVSSSVRWNPVPGATSYIFSAGTSPGASDLVSNFDNGNNTTYFPDREWPLNTTIYIRITPTNNFGQASNCAEFNFTTIDELEVPACSRLLSPTNGSFNVPLSPLLEWEPVADASGYILTIGSTPGGNDILDAVDFGNVTSTRVLEFPPNSYAFVTITPYNEFGSAIGCREEFFSTSLGCGPVIDPVSGSFVDLNPKIDLPQDIYYCTNEDPSPLRASNSEGINVLWELLNPDGIWTEVSTENEYTPEGSGDLRVTLSQTISEIEGFELNCQTVDTISVVFYEAPVIEDLEISSEMGGLRIRVIPGDSRSYEYSLYQEGPFTERNEFFISDPSNARLFIRDPLGCGIREIPLDDLQYPNFFSPNGDSANPLWQARYYTEAQGRALRTEIYDRFGKLLVQMDPYGEGWDGTFRGYPLPESDYWFVTYFESGQVVKGHFALLR